MLGMDVICTKIAVDFQAITPENALAGIAANLELLREATRVDTTFHITLDLESEAFGRDPSRSRHVDHGQS